MKSTSGTLWIIGLCLGLSLAIAACNKAPSEPSSQTAKGATPAAHSARAMAPFATPTLNPAAGAAPTPQLAPANPGFNAYREHQKKAAKPRGDGHARGFVPPPFLPNLSPDSLRKSGRKAALPSAYDLRKVPGKLPPVRNQRNCGSCWTFSTYAVAESQLSPAESLDFSEHNLMMRAGYDYGPCDGGHGYMAGAYHMRHDGPVLESQDNYEDTGTVPSPTGLAAAKFIQRTLYLPDRASSTDNDTIKQAVMDYGAVGTAFYMLDADDPRYLSSFNTSTSAYYFSEANVATNHAVAIVGWDDNYSAANFATTPPGDGAFIIRNSWGSGWGDAGYFYMSYYSQSAYANNLVMPIIEIPDSGVNTYTYSPLGYTTSMGYSSESGHYANIFVAGGASTLSAVGFFAPSPNTSYSISIYTDVTAGKPTSGTLAQTVSGTATHTAYWTHTLGAQAVTLTAGSRFSVVVTVTTPGFTYPIPLEMPIADYSSKAKGVPGRSFVSPDGTNWSDATTLTEGLGAVAADTDVVLYAYVNGPACTPNCTGKTCGDDGCGDRCGTCSGTDICVNQNCTVCIPDCTGKTCGSNGCGGSCGSCGTDELCMNQNCVSDKSLCPDGQSCVGATTNGEAGIYACMVASGGSFSTPGDMTTCDSSNQCAGNEACWNADTASETCLRHCGVCPAGTTCMELWSGGPRGCLASGGGIPGDAQKGCADTPCVGNATCYCTAADCANANTVCIYNCSDSTCTPNCTGKTCGDDGCGGSCGSCGTDQHCMNQNCVTDKWLCPDGQNCIGVTASGEAGVYACMVSSGGSFSVPGDMTTCDSNNQCAGNEACWNADTDSETCLRHCGVCPADTTCTVITDGGARGCISTTTNTIPANAQRGCIDTPCVGNASCYCTSEDCTNANTVCITNCSDPYCTPNCAGKTCGDDGCGGSCGSCADDGNPCTGEVCTAAGTCTHPALSDGTGCNDNNACTQTDTCQAGICVGANTITCTPADQCHTAGTCNSATGLCSTPAKANGEACSDNNACTQGDTCQAGSCVAGSPVVCSAMDQCHLAGVCDPQTGACSNPPKSDGSACSDGNACTQSDTCQAGVCTGANPKACPAPDACNIGVCNPTSGLCGSQPAENGKSCNDGNACTQSDSCQAGNCVGSNPVICTAVDQCHDVGVCNTSTGVCSTPAKGNGTPCNADGNGCTQNDSCQTGVCTKGTSVQCEAQADACNAGLCTSTGDNTYTCGKNPLPKEGQNCDDGNLCTQIDTCTGGVCVGAKPVVCAEPGSCSLPGICNTATGLCDYANKADATPCNADDNGCTVGDACLAGRCEKGPAPSECQDASNPCVLLGCTSQGAESYACQQTILPDWSPCQADDPTEACFGGGCELLAANDSCETAQTLPLDTTLQGNWSDYHAYRSVAAACLALEHQGPDAYYSFTPPKNAATRVVVGTSAECDVVVVVNRDCDGFKAGCLRAANAQGAGQSETLDFPAQATEVTYLIQVLRPTTPELSEPGSFSIRASLAPLADGDTDAEGEGVEQEGADNEADSVLDGDTSETAESDAPADGDATEAADGDTTDSSDATEGDAPADGDNAEADDGDTIDDKDNDIEREGEAEGDAELVTDGDTSEAEPDPDVIQPQKPSSGGCRESGNGASWLFLTGLAFLALRRRKALGR